MSVKNNKKGCILWITGLIGSGKTTLAQELEQYFIGQGRDVHVLDGDTMRRFFPKPLGFSREDRRLNVTIAGMTANLLSSHGVIVIAAFVSPYREDRDKIKNGVNRFVEIYLSTPLEVCEYWDKRDIYKTARTDKHPDFTGITQPYEIPLNPDIEISMEGIHPSEAMEKVIRYLQKEKLISP